MTPPLDEVLATAQVVAVPMATRFRGVDVREAVLFEGPQGWTEFSPFAEYGDAEASLWLAAAIDWGWRPQPAARREEVGVNATVPAVPADAVPGVLARFDGCRTAKVTVARGDQGLADDIARVAAVRRALGAEGRIRIDANGGWSVDQAELALRALSRFDLEYAEQPCALVPELSELRARIDDLAIPIAADESVRKAADPVAVARAGAADILIVKAQPLGGVHAALELVAEAGLPAVVSSALDTSVGLGMGLALAAALPRAEFDCGLGTSSLFVTDVAREPLRPADGVIPVRRAVPDPALLRSLAAPPQRRQWWLARLARCYELLPEVG